MPSTVYRFDYTDSDKGKKHESKDSKRRNLAPFLKLPSEIRSPIWTYLDSSSLKTLRLVCQVFKNNIDSKLGLKINLDERLFEKLNVNSTLPLSASSLRVWGSHRTHDFLVRLLLNSKLVTQVQFSGPIDTSNFKKVMTRCPNLNSIHVTDRSAFDSTLRIPLKIRNIREMHLGAEGKFEDYSDMSKSQEQAIQSLTPVTPWSTYKDILSCVTLPCLKVLKIEYNFPKGNGNLEYNFVINSIFKYVINHKSIDTLTLRLHKDGNIKEDFILTLDFNLEQLNSIKLKNLISSSDSDISHLWEVILANQSQLESLDFLNDSKDFQFFSQIIKKNVKALKSLKLRKLTEIGSSSDSRIDLGVLESFSKLEELFLSRFGNPTVEVCYSNVFRYKNSDSNTNFLSQELSQVHQRNIKNSGDSQFLSKITSKLPELVQFKALPSSLKKLHIQGFTTKTDDLLWIPIKLRELEIVELQLLGYKGGIGNDTEVPRDFSRHGLGVTPSILKGLLTLRKLKVLFVEEFYNNRTSLWRDKGLKEGLKEINSICGDGLLKIQGYFGIMVGQFEPTPSFLRDKMKRDDRRDLWDGRYNQYRYQEWVEEMEDGKGNRSDRSPRPV